MQALLDINEYHVDNIAIKVNSDYKQSDIKNCNVSVDFDIRQNNDDPLVFMILLFIKLNDSKATSTSAEYHIKLDITGYFSFIEGTAEETVNKMIAPSGLSILYGVARGVIAQVTGNFKYGKFILPTLNFMEIIKKKASKVKEEMPAPLEKEKAA